MLNLFKEYNVHVTWATVGMLFFEKKEELLKNIPFPLPDYEYKDYLPVPYVNTIGPDETSDPIHYAKSLIKLIASYPHQEIASHSFLHYYCLEKGQNIHSFEADLDKSIEAAKQMGYSIQSYVFCRNQKNDAYLPAMLKRGIINYRGGENHFAYTPRGRADDSILRKIIRLLDTYVNITGNHTFNPGEINSSPPFNIPSSRFFRPYSSVLSFLEFLKIRRIKKAMLHAAKNGETFHLWWHPHNFGKNRKQNVANLRKVLQYYTELHQKYGMESMTMSELSDKLLSHES